MKQLSEAGRRRIKWLCYALLLLVFYILQTTPMLFQILGIKPVLVVPFAVCLSLFESERAAAVYGVFGGMLWDIAANKLFGFRAILLMCCCIAVALLVMYLMRNHLWNAILLVSAVMLVIQILDYLFFYLIWGYEHSWIILLKYTLPTMVYTAVVTIPIYYLMRSVAKRFNQTVRM